MAVYYIHRGPYAGPYGFTVQKFDAPDLLAFLKDLAAKSSEDADYAEGLLKPKAYGLGHLLEEHGKAIASTTSAEGLAQLLAQHYYAEGEVINKPAGHGLWVSTDDDELEMAYAFLDDEAVAQHGAELAYVLHGCDAVPLDCPDTPAESYEPARPVAEGASLDGEGATYMALQWAQDSCNSDEMNVLALEGVRLPELAKALKKAELDEPPAPLAALKALAGRAKGSTEVLMQLFARLDSEGLMEIDPDDDELEIDLPDEPNAAGVLRSGKHFAQVGLGSDFMGASFVLFDDVWAAAHREIADSIIALHSSWIMVESDGAAGAEDDDDDDDDDEDEDDDD